MGTDYTVKEDKLVKVLVSPNHNYLFDKQNGFFARWGKSKEAPDPQCGYPEIADIEITTICNGINGKLCPFCYKGNTPNGRYMPYDKFKRLFRKLPRTITQIAFGVDSECASNPDWWDIFSYCRNNDYNYVVPNVTVANITPETADKLAKVCGAVAVSRYSDKSACYNTVKLLTDRGLSQVNIHAMISNETYDDVMETFRDRVDDHRLAKLNAIVLLGLKPKGRGQTFTPVDFDKFKQLVTFALGNKIGIGFDSCSQPAFVEAIRGREDYDKLLSVSEPCEASCFSVYIDVDGKYYPCSFMPDCLNWSDGLDVLACDNFLQDIWDHDKTKQFRAKLLNKHRKCPAYNLITLP